MEAYATYFGVVTAYRLGCQRIILEGDAWNIFKLSDVFNNDVSLSRVILDNLSAFSHYFDYCMMSWTRCAANSIVQSLAKFPIL